MNSPADPPSAAEQTFPGARWAAGLGAALLLSLAALTVVRWSGRSDASAEQIVQIPVARAAPTPTPRPEDLAPDPGDHP